LIFPGKKATEHPTKRLSGFLRLKNSASDVKPPVKNDGSEVVKQGNHLLLKPKV
jgi:hypothetical protein